jgi:hypothetical protein
MSFQVMHRNRRLIDRHRQRLGESAPHQQRPGQTRATRIGHGIDVIQRTIALSQRFAQQGTTRRMWSREASSGTTPPYSACIATCE